VRPLRWIATGTLDALRVAHTNTTAQGALGLIALGAGLFTAFGPTGPISFVAGFVLMLAALGLFFLFYVWNRHLGPYEVLHGRNVWDIQTSDGSLVTEEKEFAVRWLQDNVFSWCDYAWGDGEIVADYSCSPGKFVDEIDIEDRRKWLVISLGGMRNRGDREVLRTRRLIRNGFLNSREWLTFEIVEPTKEFELVIRFPKDRPCTRAWLRRRGIRRERELDLDRYMRAAEGGRQELVVSGQRPSLGDSFTINWNW
jgi:hypothetical protein